MRPSRKQFGETLTMFNTALKTKNEQKTSSTISQKVPENQNQQIKDTQTVDYEPKIQPYMLKLARFTDLMDSKNSSQDGGKKGQQKLQQSQSPSKNKVNQISNSDIKDHINSNFKQNQNQRSGFSPDPKLLSSDNISLQAPSDHASTIKQLPLHGLAPNIPLNSGQPSVYKSEVTPMMDLHPISRRISSFSKEIEHQTSAAKKPVTSKEEKTQFQRANTNQEKFQMQIKEILTTNNLNANSGQQEPISASHILRRNTTDSRASQRKRNPSDIHDMVHTLQENSILKNNSTSENCDNNIQAPYKQINVNRQSQKVLESQKSSHESTSNKDRQNYEKVVKKANDNLKSIETLVNPDENGSETGYIKSVKSSPKQTKDLNQDLNQFSCKIQSKSPLKQQITQEAATSTKFSVLQTQSRKSETILPVFSVGVKLFENDIDKRQNQINTARDQLRTGVPITQSSAREKVSHTVRALGMVDYDRGILQYGQKTKFYGENNSNINKNEKYFQTRLLSKHSFRSRQSSLQDGVYPQKSVSSTTGISDIELGNVSIMSQTQLQNSKLSFVAKDKNDYFQQVRQKNQKFFGKRSGSEYVSQIKSNLQGHHSQKQQIQILKDSNYESQHKNLGLQRLLQQKVGRALQNKLLPIGKQQQKVQNQREQLEKIENITNIKFDSEQEIYDVEKMASFLGKTYNDYFQDFNLIETKNLGLKSDYQSQIINPYQTNQTAHSGLAHEKYLEYIRKNRQAQRMTKTASLTERETNIIDYKDVSICDSSSNRIIKSCIGFQNTSNSDSQESLNFIKIAPQQSNVSFESKIKQSNEGQNDRQSTNFDKDKQEKPAESVGRQKVFETQSSLKIKSADPITVLYGLRNDLVKQTASKTQSGRDFGRTKSQHQSWYLSSKQRQVNDHTLDQARKMVEHRQIQIADLPQEQTKLWKQLQQRQSLSQMAQKRNSKDEVESLSQNQDLTSDLQPETDRIKSSRFPSSTILGTVNYKDFNKSYYQLPPTDIQFAGTKEQESIESQRVEPDRNLNISNTNSSEMKYNQLSTVMGDQAFQRKFEGKRTAIPIKKHKLQQNADLMLTSESQRAWNRRRRKTQKFQSHKIVIQRSQQSLKSQESERLNMINQQQTQLIRDRNQVTKYLTKFMTFSRKEKKDHLQQIANLKVTQQAISHHSVENDKKSSISRRTLSVESQNSSGQRVVITRGSNREKESLNLEVREFLIKKDSDLNSSEQDSNMNYSKDLGILGVNRGLNSSTSNKKDSSVMKSSEYSDKIGIEMQNKVQNNISDIESSTKLQDTDYVQIKDQQRQLSEEKNLQQNLNPQIPKNQLCLAGKSSSIPRLIPSSKKSTSDKKVPMRSIRERQKQSMKRPDKRYLITNKRLITQAQKMKRQIDQQMATSIQVKEFTVPNIQKLTSDYGKFTADSQKENLATFGPQKPPQQVKENSEQFFESQTAVQKRQGFTSGTIYRESWIGSALMSNNDQGISPGTLKRVGAGKDTVLAADEKQIQFMALSQFDRLLDQGQQQMPQTVDASPNQRNKEAEFLDPLAQGGKMKRNLSNIKAKKRENVFLEATPLFQQQRKSSSKKSGSDSRLSIMGNGIAPQLPKLQISDLTQNETIKPQQLVVNLQQISSTDPPQQSYAENSYMTDITINK